MLSKLGQTGAVGGVVDCSGKLTNDQAFTTCSLSVEVVAVLAVELI